MTLLKSLGRTPERLIGQIQHYAWGGKGEQAVIPKLLGQETGDKLWAELWLGVHPTAPTAISSGAPFSEKYT
jgi:mannose-6-phosphate isomerase